MLVKYLGYTNHVLIIQFCSSSFRGRYKQYIIKVIVELVNIDPVISTIRDPFSILVDAWEKLSLYLIAAWLDMKSPTLTLL